MQTAVAAGIRCPHCDRPHTAADCWKLHPEKRPAWMQRANRAKATGGRLMRSTVGDGVQEWGMARTSSWRACLGAQLQPREGEATMKKWTLYVDKAGGSVCPMAPTKVQNLRNFAEFLLLLRNFLRKFGKKKCGIDAEFSSFFCGISPRPNQYILLWIRPPLPRPVGHGRASSPS